MNSSATMQKLIRKSLLLLTLLFSILWTCSFVAGQAAPGKVVGTVKSVNGNALVLTTDSGAEANVVFTDSAKIVQAAPGQADLKSATPIKVSDIQPGDRVAARGQMGDGGSLTASLAIVMKQGDIAQRQQSEREQWRHGVGGIVKEVSADAGTITVTNSLAVGGKPVLIHVPSGTEIKRYSPDSVKFDDAKPGTLDQIKPGDQVRARGVPGADGSEFTAQAIVSGSFKDIAGTVISTDAANGTVTISDLKTKRPVTIKAGQDSQLRKLPQFAAMGIAMRLKRGEAGTFANTEGSAHSGTQAEGSPPERAESAAGGERGMRGQGWRGNGNGPPDFQQMLARMPAVSISDLNKGDAVMVVATEGTTTTLPMAITLLSGVEPIFTASPAGANASTILSPWNLGQPAGGGEGAAQ